MISIINEYRYSKEDSTLVLKAYYAFFPRTQVAHYAALALCLLSAFLYYRTTLVRFLVFAIILLLLFLYRFFQMSLGAKYDAARIKEDTGVDNPMMRYEFDKTLRIYREGKLQVALKMEDIAGCKEMNDVLVVFTTRNYTAMFKNGFYLEGGATALKALLRENGVVVK